MRNLSEAATNEENLSQLVKRLLGVVRASEDAQHVACACGILSNLTCNNIRNKQTVCSDGGIAALVDCLRRFPDVEEATEPALCALRHCTARHQFAEQAQLDLRLSNAFPQLIILLSTLRAPVETSSTGKTVVSLAMEVWILAVNKLREDPNAETDGVPMWGVVEGAVSALHQLATDKQVAMDLVHQTEALILTYELLRDPYVSQSDDEVLERELLGLLYQIAQNSDGASAIDEAGFMPILTDCLRRQHRSVATYASGILKRLESDRPPQYRQELDMEASSGWQRDGMEPELFSEMYRPGSMPIVHTGGSFTAVSGSNYVDLWASHQVSSENVNLFEDIFVAEEPVLLARVLAKGSQIVTCSALSSRGSKLAISTGERTHVYSLSDSKTQPIKILPVTFPAATAIAFHENSILVCTGDFKLMQYMLVGADAGNEVLVQEKCGIVTSIVSLEGSSTAALLTSRAQIFVVDLEKGTSSLVRLEATIPKSIVLTRPNVLTVAHQPLKSDDRRLVSQFSIGHPPKLEATYTRGELGPGFGGARSMSTNASQDTVAMVDGHGNIIVIKDKTLRAVQADMPMRGDLLLGWNLGWRRTAGEKADVLSAVGIAIPPPIGDVFKLKKYGQK
ncbi:unnamed protein product, partial [Mesorhabditis spiculigera]